MEDSNRSHEVEDHVSDAENQSDQDVHNENERDDSIHDQYSVEAENTTTVQDTKPLTVDYSYQTQKIIVNVAEEEDDESPTYKDFFDKSQKKHHTESEKESPEKKSERTPQRWKILYAKALESRANKEELRKEYELLKEDRECTFRPKITPHYSSKLQNSPDSADNEYYMSVQDRNKVWQAKREAKRKEAHDMVKDREMYHCTFHPDIARAKEPQVISLSAYCSKGVDQYLRRQIIAKQAKDEKDMIMLNPLAKIPPHAYKKEGNITIPKGPDFTKGKNFEINSLKKPFDFPAPKYQSQSAESVSPQKEFNYQKSVKTLVDPIQVNNVKFGQAIQMLHHELHRFDIN